MITTVQPPWIAPSLCGCALRVTVTRTLSAAKRAALIAQFGPALAATWIDRLVQTAQFDETVETREILHQCPGHAAFVGAEALWGELQHLEGIGHGVDTCTCRIAHWRDNRTDAPFVAMEHPEGTTRCPLHADLADTQKHHDVVEAENVRKNLVVSAVARALDIEAATLQVTYQGADRTALTVGHPTIPQATLLAAMKATPASIFTGDLTDAIEIHRAAQTVALKAAPPVSVVTVRVSHG